MVFSKFFVSVLWISGISMKKAPNSTTPANPRIPRLLRISSCSSPNWSHVASSPTICTSAPSSLPASSHKPGLDVGHHHLLRRILRLPSNLLCISRNPATFRRCLPAVYRCRHRDLLAIMMDPLTVILGLTLGKIIKREVRCRSRRCPMGLRGNRRFLCLVRRRSLWPSLRLQALCRYMMCSDDEVDIRRSTVTINN